MTVKTNMSAVALYSLIAVTAVTATFSNEYIFEFGQKYGGEKIYDKQGMIGILSYKNDFNIPVPRNMRISYVRVIVNALSSPKVDFDSDTRTVTIHYSWTQVPGSSYKLFVKGVPAD